MMRSTRTIGSIYPTLQQVEEEKAAIGVEEQVAALTQRMATLEAIQRGPIVAPTFDELREFMPVEELLER